MNVADKLAHINCTYLIEEKAQIIPCVIFFLFFVTEEPTFNRYRYQTFNSSNFNVAGYIYSYIF